ncbi:MAG: DUF1735 domain-containing protein [Prevotella sp.]|jgi:hypothetical protein|nr:DUF1735 domain-containing protein [Prevotella sp.]
MKQYLKYMLALPVGALLLGACSNSDIDLSQVDESRYQTSEVPVAYLESKYGTTDIDSVIFNNEGKTAFIVKSSVAGKSAGQATLGYDAAVLEQYNKEHGTNYQAMPQDLVTIEAANGDTVNVSYKTAESLAQGKYAIPLSLKGSNVSKEKGDFVLLVDDISKMPNCHKESGLQVISCMEVNDANPLYNLCFTLKKSGKYFFDQVILFSGNINFDAATGRVYNYNNENVQHLLDYKEKYLEPLQQKGMKVILGILGNHDRANFTNLTETGAKDFALELKSVMDAYNLDGVFFDDEYANPGPYPGFEPTESTYYFSRLCYYLKQYAPDKLIEVYILSGTSSMEEVYGKQPGEFLDYAIADYGDMHERSESYPGLPKTGFIMGSSEFARGYIIDSYDCEKIVERGLGGTMIFSLAPEHTDLDCMNRIAKAFYDDEVVQTGSYSKDW